MKNLLDLAHKFERISDELPRELNEIKKKVVMTVVSDLAVKTPVDTSQALSNWQVSNGEPILDSDKIPPYASGIAGSTQGQSIAATKAAAKYELRDTKPGEVVFISNVLPYIKRLNDGYSTQTPAGFVERAQLLGKVYLKNAKIRILKNG